MKVRDQVAWKWANGIAEGTIEAVHTERTEIISKGKKVVRNGTSENPAIVIRHTYGTKS